MTLSQDFALEYLLDELRIEYASEAFELIRNRNQLRRITSNGFQALILSVAEYQEVCVIDCFVGIRIHEIEEVVLPYTKTSPAYYQDALTIITSYGKFLGRPFDRFKASSVDDLDEISRYLIQFIWKDAIPFLDQYSELNQIDLLINSDPFTPSSYFFNQAYRCMKGITAAKLSQNTEYYRLIPVYEQLLDQLPQGKLLIKSYQMLINHLEEWFE